MILNENLFEDIELIKSKNESLNESKELKEERLSRFDAYKYIEEFLYNILLNPNKEDYLEYEFYKKFINSFNKGKDPSNDSSVLESIYDILEWLYDIEKIDLDDFNKFAIVDIIKKIVKNIKKRKNNVFIKEAKEESKNLNEEYKARWDNMVTYSNPIKQQYADLVNDQIYDALDNIDVLASSKISDLPEQTDFGFDQAERVSKAISNLVRTMTREYFLFTDLKDESLNEVKIADKIIAKQDTKEMTRRAIKMLKDLGGDYEDLAKEFKDAYGEDAIEECIKEQDCKN